MDITAEFPLWHPRCAPTVRATRKQTIMEDILTSSVSFWTVIPDGALKTVCRRYRDRRMAKASEALNDATLKAIGIYRCEIPWLARNHSATDET